MDKTQHTDPSSRRVCGRQKLLTTAMMDHGGALMSLAGCLQLWEQVAALTQALAAFGPLKRAATVEVGDGVVHVDILDASDAQDFAFDPAMFEDFCQGVARVARAAEQHKRENGSESLDRLREARNRLATGDIDAVDKLVDRLNESGGVELVGHTGEVIQLGPKKVPRPVRHGSQEANLEMEVAWRRESVFVKTDKGEFLLPWDGQAAFAEGDRVRVEMDALAGAVRCVTADAAVHAGNQLPIEFDT